MLNKDKLEKINDDINNLWKEKRKFFGFFIENDLGIFCNLLESIGYINNSQRCDERVYKLRINSMGFDGIITYIEFHEYNFICVVILSKYKSYNKKNVFNNIRFDIDLGNPDEKIQELLDVVRTNIKFY